MKKFKKFLSNKKNVSKSETTLAQSAMAKKGSMLSLGSKTTGDYEIKPKDLDKIHKAVIDKDVKKVEKLAIKGVNSRDAQDRCLSSLIFVLRLTLKRFIPELLCILHAR